MRESVMSNNPLRASSGEKGKKRLTTKTPKKKKKKKKKKEKKKRKRGTGRPKKFKKGT